MESTTETYSLVIETENLSLANSDCLWRTLDSIEKALARVSAPRESLLVNSGDVSAVMLDKLALRYPWITPIDAPTGANYYESKMFGIHRATGDIVVLMDSDCTYNEDCLAGLLAPFCDAAVRVVAGETSFVGKGPYILTLCIAHSFDGYSGATDVYPVNGYYANNVAIRRSLALELPIPTKLPLYRHGCSWHCVELRRQGETIWAQPRSRAAHSPPEGISHFFWRFLLFGRDRAVRARLGLVDDAPRAGGQGGGVYGTLKKRLWRACQREPAQVLWLPLAAIIIGCAFVLIRLGQLLSHGNPEIAISHFGAIEGVHYPTLDEYIRK